MKSFDFLRKHISSFRKIQKFIPKTSLVKMHYYLRTGRKLNLKNPKRFSDKLYWYKLYYRDEMMRTCTDKCSVREYVRSQGLEDILNECYGVYDSADEINWNELPDSFVIKDTLGGANSGIILVFNKSSFDIESSKKTMRRWQYEKQDRKVLGGDWVYESRKAKIIIEKILVASPSDDLPDYKFFCFNGKVFCSYLMRNYTMHPKDGENAFLNRDYELLDATRTDYRRITKQPNKPVNYEKMVEIAEILSKRFPHVRVDLYNINGKIVFGELTFFTNAGIIPFDPDSFDYEMGKQFILPERNVLKKAKNQEAI